MNDSNRFQNEKQPFSVKNYQKKLFMVNLLVDFGSYRNLSENVVVLLLCVGMLKNVVKTIKQNGV